MAQEMVAQFMYQCKSLSCWRLTLVNPDDGACVEFENQAVYVLEVPCKYPDAAILYQVVNGIGSEVTPAASSSASAVSRGDAGLYTNRSPPNTFCQ